MNIANKISTFRILSVPLFVGMLLYYSPQRDYLRFVSLGIFILAVISDAADGYIARIRKQQTKAGTILDPFADKVLLSSAFVCLYIKKGPIGVDIPLWIVLAVLSRDLIIIIGFAIIYILKQGLVLIPTAWGKFTTAFQMLTVIAILLRFDYVFIIWWIAVILTLFSGIQYIRGGFRVLYAQDSQRNTH